MALRIVNTIVLVCGQVSDRLLMKLDNFFVLVKLKGATGWVHVLKAISRHEMEDMIKLINDKADILRKDGEVTEVKVTGAGCSQLRARLEEGLKVK